MLKIQLKLKYYNTKDAIKPSVTKLAFRSSEPIFSIENNTLMLPPLYKTIAKGNNIKATFVPKNKTS